MIKSILSLVPAGSTGQDAQRAAILAGQLAHDTGAELTFYHVDRNLSRLDTIKDVTRLLKSRNFDVLYMEGTGIGTGWPLISAGKKKQLYVVSSGDPISGFFRVTQGPLPGYAFGIYENLLMKHCAAFIGWTPYLTGRALELGAPRAVTIEGGAELHDFCPPTPDQKKAARARFGIAQDHLVCSVVGSIRWSSRQLYAYGLELIETLKYLNRKDVTMLIVGDGNGRTKLEELVPTELKSRAVFTGRLSRPEVIQAMHAADIGFVTQTLDGLGSYRLTTKLPEYMASGLAVAMSPIPGFYDYVDLAGWALPPVHPREENFHRRCASWLDGLSREEVAIRGARGVEIARQRFDYNQLAARFSHFIQDLAESTSN